MPVDDNEILPAVVVDVDESDAPTYEALFVHQSRLRSKILELAFAQRTLSDTQKQVQIGTLAPIEVVRAQSTVATDQQTLTLALTNLE